MTDDKLPSVLTFPNTCQTSISVERALKNILECLHAMPQQESDSMEDKVNVALDDITLMLHAIKRD